MIFLVGIFPASAMQKAADLSENEKKLVDYAKKGDAKKVRKLLRSIDKMRDSVACALFEAVEEGHLEACKVLVKHGVPLEYHEDRGGATPLTIAAARGHIGIVKHLLDMRANIEARSHLGGTPLISAVCTGHCDVVRLLLDRRADIEARDHLGKTPLSWAAGYGFADLIKLLTEMGADTSAKDILGGTPLLTATVRRKADAVAKLLEESDDATLVTRDNMGCAPLDYAVQEKDSVGRQVRRTVKNRIGCSKCEKTSDLMKCSGCEAVYYCSRGCQVADWQEHKKWCKVIGKPQ